MKKVIITTCIAIGLLEVVLIASYFSIFNGTISTDNQDWDTFLQIFNGFVMAVLTAINIYIFYQLTVAIEDKNQERAVKEKVFEAQSVITQMRVRQYEEVKVLIYEVIAVVAKKKKENGELDLLHKKLVELDNSLLFKNYKLQDASILEGASLKIIDVIKKIQSNESGINITAFTSSLTTYIKLMETYIIHQMIIDKDVEKYVCANATNIDCTISCVAQVLDRTLKEMKRLDSAKEV